MPRTPTPSELALVRQSHVARIDQAELRARQSSRSEPIGLRGSLQFLGAWLAHHGHAMKPTRAECFFGMDRPHYLKLATSPTIMAEGAAEAERILGRTTERKVAA